MKKEPIKILKVIKSKGTHSWIEAEVKNTEGKWEKRIIRKENKNIKL